MSVEVIWNFTILVPVGFVISDTSDFECEIQETTYADKNCATYITDDKTDPELFLWTALYKHFLVKWY